jgi:hypothetical protein
MTYGTRDSAVDYYIPDDEGEGVKEVFDAVKKTAKKMIGKLDPKVIKVITKGALDVIKGKPIRQAITDVAIELGHMGKEWIAEQDIYQIMNKVLKKSGKGGLMAFGGGASYEEWLEDGDEYFSAEIANYKKNKESKGPVMRQRDTFDQSKPDIDFMARLFN